jgi:hypothetical protein
MKNFSANNKGSRKVWGVLGKQAEYYTPSHFLGEKVPLNANAFDAWDYKKSKYKRVDLVPRQMDNDGQQAGVVPQVANITPTPTPTITQTNTPSQTQTNTPSQTQTNTASQTNTPTQTPSVTPSSTPYPLPLNPTIWYDASDSSTLTLISSAGTNYVSSWISKGTTTWSLSGANTDTMPVLSASTLMPGNPNCVRFTPNTTASLRDYMVSFNNTPIGHTGSTIFQVWAKPSGSTYATALFNTRVYSGLTNGGIATISTGAPFDSYAVSITASNSISSLQNYGIGTSGSSSNLLIPVYSATNLNDKFIFQSRTPFTAGQFATFELNQSGGTAASGFTGTTQIPTINSFSLSVNNITTGGTITVQNSSVELCEIMYFDTELTNAQVEQVELYLKDKWRYDEWASPVPTPTQTASPTQTTTNTPTPSTTPPFNPLALNPMIWVDFNDASTLSLRSGQFVQSVSNKGNWTAFTGFSQTTAANQPSWSASTMGTSKSAVTISNDFLESSTIPTGSTWNSFVVLKYGGTDPFAPLQVASTFGASQSWSNLYAQRQLDRYANFKIEGTDEYRRAFNGYTGYNTTHIAQGYMSNSALTIVDYFNINNSAQTETIEANTNTTTGWPGAITNSPSFRIINNEEFGSSIPGEIGEIYMFDKELTSTDQANLINYLKTKWGIT